MCQTMSMSEKSKNMRNRRVSQESLRCDSSLATDFFKYFTKDLSPLLKRYGQQTLAPVN